MKSVIFNLTMTNFFHWLLRNLMSFSQINGYMAIEQNKTKFVAHREHLAGIVSTFCNKNIMWPSSSNKVYFQNSPPSTIKMWKSQGHKYQGTKLTKYLDFVLLYVLKWSFPFHCWLIFKGENNLSSARIVHWFMTAVTSRCQ